MSSHIVTIDSGREILEQSREKIRTLSKKRYPNLYHYIGSGSYLQKELISLYSYLLNSHNKLNEAGNIEQRFFTAFHQYCFFIDTNAYTVKIRKKPSNSNQQRTRSNHALNMFCCLGLFTKDKEPGRYSINQNMKLNTNQTFFMTIYHFNILDLAYSESVAGRLKMAKVSIGNISEAKLRGAGLNDIADRVYIINKETAFLNKLNEIPLVMQTMADLIAKNGYCTRQDIFDNVPLPIEEIKKLITDFRQDIEYNYNYRPATKRDRAKYNYTGKQYIYTAKESD